MMTKPVGNSAKRLSGSSGDYAVAAIRQRFHVAGTSAGSISPIRRQPFSRSHVRGSATSDRRYAPPNRPSGGGDQPFHPLNQSPS